MSPIIRDAFVYAAYVGAYLGLIGLLPYQLRRWGWDATLADGVLALSTVGFIAGAFHWAAVPDRYGRRREVFAACMMSAALLALLVSTTAGSGPTR